MKKISLLLSLSFLLWHNGIAQKDQSGTANTVPAKKTTEKNFAYKGSQSAASIYKAKQHAKSINSYTLESFEGSTFPPSGWTKQDPDAGTGWAQLLSGTTPLPGWTGGTQTVPPGGGGKVAYCTWSTGGATSNDQWLITPSLNVSSGDSLKFYLWWFGSYQDTVYVKLSTTTNATASFTTTLKTLDTNSLRPMSTWKRFAIDLTPYAGQNIYIAFQEKVADNYNNGAYIALDLVSLGTTPAIDAATISIDVPAIIAPGTASPVATVFNYSYAPQTFDVTMNISGGYTSTKTVTALGTNSSHQVTFDPWTSITGIDTITVYTQLAGNAYTANDTLLKIVHVFYDVQPTSIDVYPVVGAGISNSKSHY